MQLSRRTSLIPLLMRRATLTAWMLCLARGGAWKPSIISISLAVSALGWGGIGRLDFRRDHGQSRSHVWSATDEHDAVKRHVLERHARLVRRGHVPAPCCHLPQFTRR